jgi:predicted secreted protein
MQTLMMLGLMLQENVVTDYVWQLAARLRKPAAKKGS